MWFDKKWVVLYLCVGLTSLTTLSFAQEMTVTGEVRDVNTYEKIRGVNIFVKGTGIGTTSDYTGHFSLKLPSLSENTIVVFRHVGYELAEIGLDSLKTLESVYLQPRVIQLQGVQVEAEGYEMEIEKDIPQTVAVIESRDFEIQGYVDAGDLLRIDHSVQVEEELSGEKTVSIRGGNPDEVVVLYNGVKLNNAYDNIYDLSLIDLEDVERFEIIKGSNTALYGPEAFSGVINIVPKVQQDYNIRFQQRVGTYRSGNWGLHLYKKLGRLNTSYSHRRGGIEREFEGFEEGRSKLENSSLHHTANLSYSFSEHDDGTPASSLSFMWLYTEVDYTNERDNELLDNFSHLLSAKYTGSVFGLRDVDLSISWRHLEEDQFLSFSIPNNLTGSQARGIKDRSLYVNAGKGFELGPTDLLVAYQFQKAELVDEFDDRRSNNFGDEQTRPLSSDYERLHHGLVGILKYSGEAGSDYLQEVNVDLSVRHDRVEDVQTEAVYSESLPVSQRTGQFEENDWVESMAKFSVSLTGYRRDLSTNAFFNFGRNVKFPTLFQQVSTFRTGSIVPEENKSLEFGVTVSRETQEHETIYGWSLAGNYFLNNYANKIIEVDRLLGGRSQFFSNPVGRISGFESKASIYLFRKKMTVAFGWSRYSISDKAAFPFKSDFKYTLTGTIDHAGYSLQVHGFKEGEQAGLVLDENSFPVVVFLPDYTNVDVHLSKTFEIGKFKVFANASGRNLIDDDDVELLGLNIRDRRFYITVGAQY